MKKHLRNLLKGTHKTIHHFRKKVVSMAEDKPKKGTKIPKPEVEASVQRVIVEFSLTSVVKATLLILMLIALSHFVEKISTILVLLFIALMFSAALDPSVDYLEEKKIPRPLGVILIYLLAIFILAGFVSTLVPLLVSQLTDLGLRVSSMIQSLTNNGVSDIPLYDKIYPYIEPYINDLLSGENQQVIIDNLQKAISNIASQLSGLAGNVFTAFAAIFNGVLNLVLVLVLTFFMIVEEQTIQEFIKSLFPSKYGDYIIAKSNAVKHGTGNWLRGQLTLSLIMGSLTFIFMWIFQIEFALTLGFFAGLAEFIPVIGPVITAIAALLIALNGALWQIIAVAIFFAILQFLEGNILIPLIMRKAVNVHPVIAITAALVAYQFLGVFGLIMAIPTATVAGIFVRDYTEKEK